MKDILFVLANKESRFKKYLFPAVETFIKFRDTFHKDKLTEQEIKRFIMGQVLFFAGHDGQKFIFEHVFNFLLDEIFVLTDIQLIENEIYHSPYNSYWVVYRDSKKLVYDKLSGVK